MTQIECSCYELHKYICCVILIIPLWVGGVYSPVSTNYSPQVMDGRGNERNDQPRCQGRSALVETGGWALVEIVVVVVFINAYKHNSTK